MFTGIIQAIGKIQQIEDRNGDKRFTIHAGKLNMSDVAIGDSIACNGVCLTVVELSGKEYQADVSAETLKLTTLGKMQTAASLNLEKALTPSTRIGGHFVSGHVDGVGEILEISKDSRSTQYKIKIPDRLLRYTANKGSITLDGVSLTINDTHKNSLMLNLVPHTLQQTIASGYTSGQSVNLEIDLIARYIERLLTTEKGSIKNPQLNRDFLAQHGFIK